ncbi:MAG TPA: nicotinate-nucleotide--dimethylbenzimidazole phosphoribosyltransferase [Planctomycetota bacterium]|nr:nicotinate-nucleotide--dimethylbenzimidazole phosphoribosyltransferase [Planctomycetota bacterium]
MVAADAIPPLDHQAITACQKHLDSLTKPAGSLGRIEELALRLSGIRGFPPAVNKAHVLVFAGDHGVTAEGVSAFPKEVTPQMVLNFLNGGAAINVLAKQAYALVTVIDVGVDAEISPPQRGPASVLGWNGASFVKAKVRRGTRNFVREDAMTPEETQRALAAGQSQAQSVIERGAEILILGEMGIGNTTSAAALVSALLPLEPRLAVGRGTGVDESGMKRKLAAVSAGLARAKFSSAEVPSPERALQALSALGGLEIAAMTGAILAAATLRTPVLIDGYISSSAALCAVRLQPAVLPYLFFSHKSAESGHSHLLEKLDTRPLLELDLRLGEGTGAVLALPLLRAACAIVREMATFDSAGVAKKSRC